MADSKALVIQSGITKQIPNADTLIVSAGIRSATGSGLTVTADTGSITMASATSFSSTASVTGVFSPNGGVERTSSAALNIATANSGNVTAVNIGTGDAVGTVTISRSGQSTNIAGNLTVSGTETVVGATTFNSTVTIGDGAGGPDTLEFNATTGRLSSAALPNVLWLKEINHNFSVDNSTTASTAGGSLFMLSGAGSAGAGATAGASGGIIRSTGGAAGAGGTTGAGGLGGISQLIGGAGGAGGSTTGAGGAGGPILIEGGVGGVSGTTGGAGGIGGGITLTGAIGGAGGVAIGGAGGQITLTSGTGGVGSATVAGAAGGANYLFGGVGGASGGVAAGAGGPMQQMGGTGGAGLVAVVGGVGGVNMLAGGGGGAGGVGSQTTVAGGTGGIAGSTTGAGGVGGVNMLAGGTGGAGNATALGGAGGALTITGGSAGADGGAGTGANGTVSIGATNTSSIAIGASGIITSLTGTHQVTAGSIINTTGTGNINLPNNASARFQIETVAVSANVTAANLGTLTAGPASNADALHTHSFGGTVSYSGTSGEALTAGQLVAVQNSAGSPRVFLADANGTAPLPNVIGTVNTTVGGAGIAVSVIVTGEVSTPDSVWDAVPAVTDVGKRAYVSGTAGNWTFTAPSTAGDWVLKTGIISQGGTGAVKVLVQIGEGVLL